MRGRAPLRRGRAAGVDRIDLLKIDVEGHELHVLRGIDEPLWPRLDHVAVEVADRAGELALVLELFAAYGMRTSVRRSAQKFQDTNLFMVFAGRSEEDAAAVPAASTESGIRHSASSRGSTDLGMVNSRTSRK